MSQVEYMNVIGMDCHQKMYSAIKEAMKGAVWVNWRLHFALHRYCMMLGSPPKRRYECVGALGGDEKKREMHCLG